MALLKANFILLRANFALLTANVALLKLMVCVLDFKIEIYKILFKNIFGFYFEIHEFVQKNMLIIDYHHTYIFIALVFHVFNDHHIP